MKFYKRFPGDITIKTGDLTLVEFGAYDRLLDHYYAKEQPIDPKRVYTVTRCQCAADRRAVDRVLAEYWTMSEAGWVQERADEMIAEAQPKIAAARENGKLGGRPKGSKNKPSGFSEETQGANSAKGSQSQNQKEHSEANASAAGAAAGSVDKRPEDMTKLELWRAGKSLLREAGVPEAQCGSFVGKLVTDYGETVVIDAVRATVLAGPVDPKEYLKATCMRLKGERAADHGKPLTVPGESAEQYLERRQREEAAAEVERQVSMASREARDAAVARVKHKAAA